LGVYILKLHLRPRWADQWREQRGFYVRASTLDGLEGVCKLRTGGILGKRFACRVEGEEEGVAAPVDLLEATRRVATTAIDCGCPFVIAGTYLTLRTTPVLSAGSPSRALVRVFSLPVLVSVDDMCRSLCHYVDIDAAQVGSLRAALAPLRGRPYFFYDQLFSTWVFRPPRVGEEDRSLRQCAEVRDELVRHHTALFKKLGADITKDFSPRTRLLSSLYFACVFADGRMMVDEENVHELIRTSVTPARRATRTTTAASSTAASSTAASSTAASSTAASSTAASSTAASRVCDWEIDLEKEPVAGASVRLASESVFSRFPGRFGGLCKIDVAGVEGYGRDSVVGYSLEKWIVSGMCLRVDATTLAATLQRWWGWDGAAKVPLANHVMIRPTCARRAARGEFEANVNAAARDLQVVVNGDGSLPAPDHLLYGEIVPRAGDTSPSIRVQIRFQSKTGIVSLLESLRNLNYRSDCAEQVTIRILVTLQRLCARAMEQVDEYNARFPFQPIIVLDVGKTTTGESLAREKAGAGGEVSSLGPVNIHVLALNGGLSPEAMLYFQAPSGHAEKSSRREAAGFQEDHPALLALAQESLVWRDGGLHALAGGTAGE
jgi:hypothetical protein